MARKRNGRFQKKRTTRRKRKPKFNLVDAGLSLFIANALTTGLARSNLMDFVTGRQNGVYNAGADGSLRLTIPELLKGINTGSGSWNKEHGEALGPIISRNFSDNMASILFAVIGAPIAVKMAKKVLRKPVLTPLNKIIKQTGLDVKV